MYSVSLFLAVWKQSLCCILLNRCEEGLLDCMILGSNIAKNAALRENVFMMAVCIELRIPLFLVGKPGSSKSLAKSIIQNSMQGQGSRSPVLREFMLVSGHWASMRMHAQVRYAVVCWFVCLCFPVATAARVHCNGCLYRGFQHYTTKSRFL